MRCIGQSPLPLVANGDNLSPPGTKPVAVAELLCALGVALFFFIRPIVYSEAFLSTLAGFRAYRLVTNSSGVGLEYLVMKDILCIDIVGIKRMRLPILQLPL